MSDLQPGEVIKPSLTVRGKMVEFICKSLSLNRRQRRSASVKRCGNGICGK